MQGNNTNFENKLVYLMKAKEAVSSCGSTVCVTAVTVQHKQARNNLHSKVFLAVRPELTVLGCPVSPKTLMIRPTIWSDMTQEVPFEIQNEHFNRKQLVVCFVAEWSVFFWNVLLKQYYFEAMCKNTLCLWTNARRLNYMVLQSVPSFIEACIRKSWMLLASWPPIDGGKRFKSSFGCHSLSRVQLQHPMRNMLHNCFRWQSSARLWWAHADPTVLIPHHLGRHACEGKHT